MTRLVITRRSGQSFQIGDDVTVTLVETKGQQARIAIEAPPDVRILRDDAAVCSPRAGGSTQGPEASVGG
jgi:carbon storage regulator